MCDGLIVTHFFNASANGSSKIHTDTPDAHVFVQNEPLNQLWIFLPPGGVEPVGDWLAHLLPDHPAGKGFNSWSVTSYHKESALTIYNDWKASSFDMLYEMRRPALPKGAAEHACPKGFVIRHDDNFLRSHDPAHMSEALLASETTLTIVEEGTGEVAGFLTYLLNKERMYISSVETFPKFRRRGLAKALMTRALETEKGESVVWLTVFAENVGAVMMYFGMEFRVERCMWVLGGANPT